MKKYSAILVALVVLVGLTFTSAALAGYPDKPINYVICFNPGGESDITARIQQQSLEKVLGCRLSWYIKRVVEALWVGPN